MIVELLKREPDCTLPEGQAKTFQLLLELVEEQGDYTLQDIVKRSHLPSPLAFWSRLRHLEAKGLIKMTTTAPLPTSVLSKA